jgi:AraC-like DNA-binding protein
LAARLDELSKGKRAAFMRRALMQAWAIDVNETIARALILLIDKLEAQGYSREEIARDGRVPESLLATLRARVEGERWSG